MTLLAKESPDPYENLPMPGGQEDLDAPAEASPPVIGWAYREAAHEWGECLLEALIANGHEAEVRVHPERQWYQLKLVNQNGEMTLETPQQVQLVLEQIGNGTW